MKSQEHYDQADRDLYDLLELLTGRLVDEVERAEEFEICSLTAGGAGTIVALLLQKINWQLHRIASAIEGMESRP